jgi:dienelactone hydrolase
MVSSAQRVSFQSGGRTLSGTLVRPAFASGSSPALVFVHGWRSSQQSYVGRAESLAEEGFIGLTFDLHGHGESETDGSVLDSTRTEDFLADVVAAYDFLVLQGDVDANRIGVVGASLGAYLGVWATTRRRVRWLALRAPADHPQDKLGSALDALSGFSGDLLVVESELDRVIPHELVMSYLRAMADDSRVTHEVIRGAQHELSEPEWRARFVEILRQWFRNRFAAAN